MPATRSWLCASALNPRLFEKAREVGADIVHPDLEDSVPEDKKALAREALPALLAAAGDSVTALRINQLRSRDGLRDLLFLVEHELVPEIIILPKLSVPADPQLARAVLDEAGFQHTWIFGIVETVRTLWELRALSADCPLDGLIFGAADFATDIRVQFENVDFSYVRQEIALIAHRLGAVAIDSPCFKLRNDVALREQLVAAQRFGFVGKIAIHPAQVPIINEQFQPSLHAIASAHRLLRASTRSDITAIRRFEDMMVGPPFVKYARHVVAESKRCRTG